MVRVACDGVEVTCGSPARGEVTEENEAEVADILVEWRKGPLRAERGVVVATDGDEDPFLVELRVGGNEGFVNTLLDSPK